MIKDYREIREVVMQYVNGCAAGDVELAKKAFHKDAVMYGYLNGAKIRLAIMLISVDFPAPFLPKNP